MGIKLSINENKSDIVIIANPDIEISENTIKECILVLNSNDKYGVIAPTIKNINCFGENAWKLPDYKYDLLSLFYITNKFCVNKYKYNKSYFETDISEVDCIPGSLLICKSKVLKKIEYFDEGTFLYCEERILAKKIISKGYKTIILNNSYYKHQHGAIIKKNNNKINQYKILYASKRYFLEKYCNVNRFKLFCFDILSRISIIEKYILGFVR